MKEQQPLISRRFLAAVCVVTAAGAAVLYLDSVCAGLSRLLHATRPLLLGVLFASMLRPSYDRLYRDFSRFAVRHGRDPQAGWLRVISLTGTVLPPLTVLASIICILIPQVISSVQLFTDNFSSYSGNFESLLGAYERTALAGWIPAAQLRAWAEQMREQLPALLHRTYDCTAAALRLLLDIGIGAVFSLYLLADRQSVNTRLMQVCGKFLRRERAEHLAEQIRLTCDVFSRFLSSQCKEALILGGLCWAGMKLFGFPYPVLISVTVGITNIIPYVGPLVGTVPSALLLLVVRPSSVIWFVLYIVVLQQIESNLIYPRIVGRSVGIPPGLVLAAITLGGGLFGIRGMILSVPAAAALYSHFETQKTHGR